MQLGGRGGVQFRPTSGGHRCERFLLPFINAFGVDIQGACCSLGGAAFTNKAQGLGPEGSIVTPAFAKLGTVFHNVRKIRPYYVRIYPTILGRGVLLAEGRQATKMQFIGHEQ